jgi:succinate dehydrogenase/fumarate reductase flavoprotein subunit
VELPRDVSGAAISMAINAGRGFQGSVVVLLSLEEIDQATKKAELVGYRAPGE